MPNYTHSNWVFGAASAKTSARSVYLIHEHASRATTNPKIQVRRVYISHILSARICKGNILLASLIWSSILAIFLIMSHEVVIMYAMTLQHKKNSQHLFEHSLSFLSELEQNFAKNPFSCLGPLQSTRVWQSQNWGTSDLCHFVEGDYQFDYVISDLGAPRCISYDKLGHGVQFFQVILHAQLQKMTKHNSQVLLQQFIATGINTIQSCGDKNHMIHLGPQSAVQHIDP